MGRTKYSDQEKEKIINAFIAAAREIIELDGAYQMCTKSEMYEYLIRIAKQPKRHAPAGMTTGFCHGWYLLKGCITKSNKMEICHYYNILTQKVKLINIKQEIIQLPTRKTELIM